MIYVSLISYTPDPERTIAAAARISTSSVSATELMKKLTPEAIDLLFNHTPGSGYLHSIMPASPSTSAEMVG